METENAIKHDFCGIVISKSLYMSKDTRTSGTMLWAQNSPNLALDEFTVAVDHTK